MVSERERELIGRLQRVIDHVSLSAFDAGYVSLPLGQEVSAAVEGRWIGLLREHVDSYGRDDLLPFRGLRACRRIMRRLEQGVAEAIR